MEPIQPFSHDRRVYLTVNSRTMPRSSLSRPPSARVSSPFSSRASDTYHCNRILPFRGGSLIHWGLTGLITSCHLIWQTWQERGVRFAPLSLGGGIGPLRSIGGYVGIRWGRPRITSRWTSRIFCLHHFVGELSSVARSLHQNNRKSLTTLSLLPMWTEHLKISELIL